MISIPSYTPDKDTIIIGAPPPPRSSLGHWSGLRVYSLGHIRRQHLAGVCLNLSRRSRPRNGSFSLAGQACLAGNRNPPSRPGRYHARNLPLLFPAPGVHRTHGLGHCGPPRCTHLSALHLYTQASTGAPTPHKQAQHVAPAQQGRPPRSPAAGQVGGAGVRTLETCV